MAEKDKPKRSWRNDLDVLGGGGSPVFHDAPKGWLETREIAAPLKEYEWGKTNHAPVGLERLIVECYKRIEDDGWVARCCYGPNGTSATIWTTTTSVHCPTHKECGRREIHLSIDADNPIDVVEWSSQCDAGRLAANRLSDKLRHLGWAEAQRLKELRQAQTGTPTIGRPKPTSGADRAEWFAWYHQEKRAHHMVDWREGANAVGLAVSTFRAQFYQHYPQREDDEDATEDDKPRDES